MENQNPEKELKPILEMYETKVEDYIVDGKQRLMPLIRMAFNFRIENLPKREKGAVRRIEGAFDLSACGLTCNSCGHNMPHFSTVLGYADVFPAKNKDGQRLKQHLYCPKCTSEIILEGRTIISGAVEYSPPGVKETRVPQVLKPRIVSPIVSGSSKN